MGSIIDKVSKVKSSSGKKSSFNIDSKIETLEGYYLFKRIIIKELIINIKWYRIMLFFII
jgi:hypothetical protein